MPLIDSIAQAEVRIGSWPAALILLAVVIVAVVALALWLGLAIGRRSGRLEAERSGREAEAAARDDAVRRSRAVLTGQIGEQLAPYLPGFPCDPADARFIGKPIDFIAFPGASAGAPVEALFIEVKTGDSRLSAAERALREAVEAGRVRWVEYRPPVGSRAPGLSSAAGLAAADTRPGPGGGPSGSAVPTKAPRRPRA
ncbi:MAG TPA: Holliday junction resolvase-like protein [Spirochaetales bacterium]|nr:Holliday junction resolvase-like protein [Spirochaetales bacterium]HPG86538.1 Holliday junction resolvase-like protein [Spirochaetales bacterium]HPM71543.1 Holliday junction resolvase-like protein [Spirochaetales bacterium]